MYAFRRWPCRYEGALKRMVAAGVVTLTALAPAWSASEEEDVTIAQILKSGWQVAGYAGAVDNRSAFILFKHPNETFLVQCRVGYDVTRTPRVHAHCYELR